MDNLNGLEEVYFKETKVSPLKEGTSIRMFTSEYMEWLYDKLNTLQAENEKLKADNVEFPSFETVQCELIKKHGVNYFMDSINMYNVIKEMVLNKHKPSNDLSENSI